MLTIGQSYGLARADPARRSTPIEAPPIRAVHKDDEYGILYNLKYRIFNEHSVSIWLTICLFLQFILLWKCHRKRKIIFRHLEDRRHVLNDAKIHSYRLLWSEMISM